MQPLDFIQTVIRRTGWSSGDTAIREGDRLIWIVTCRSGDQTVVAKNADRVVAWQAAAKSIALVMADELFGRFDPDDED